MRALEVELLHEVVEPGLLLQDVDSCGSCGFSFEREVHAFMASVLLRPSGLDAACKDVGAVKSDLVEIVHRLRQVVNVKG